MRVVGTAGHVDHGKSTLVHALTGIDPDRLKEEKARGMTIDLGFAWFDLAIPPHATPEPIGVVDVPGHIDFIKNMLAGVGGIDAALLVIAADEGVMPQTREHLAILDLLAVPSVIVAMTKIDTVDDAEWLDLVELDIDDLLQGTRFADPPIVRVSPMTGEGMDALRSVMARALSQLPERRNRERPRLPIDRVFSLSGFGTVVTGTLSDGHFRTGDDVEILPAGIGARIRGMQTHKHDAAQGEPGSRLAINLSGVSTELVHRGDVVVRPNTLVPTQLVDVSFLLLPNAPRPLRHNAEASFFSGAAETPARIRLLGTNELAPGEEGWLQLRLDRPVVVGHGDRFILRQPSPSQTLGGGAVVDPHPQRRWRRFNERVVERLKLLAAGSPEDVVVDTVAGQPFHSVDDIIAGSGLDVQVARTALNTLLASGAVVTIPTSPKAVLLTASRRDDAFRLLSDIVSSFHSQFPLRTGIPKGELRTRLSAMLGCDVDAKVFAVLLDSAQAAGRVISSHESVRLKQFEIELSPEQQTRVARALEMLASAGVSSPSENEILVQLGDDRLLGMLVEQGRVVRIGDGIFYRSEDFDEITQRVRNHVAAKGAITLAQTRDLFETSRRYAQAILEELDTRGVTRRVGDERVLRTGAAPAADV